MAGAHRTDAPRPRIQGVPAGATRGFEMTVRIDTNGFWDSKIRTQLENAIRGCIDEQREDEEWSVLITASAFGTNLCSVLVKTPNQVRQRIFFDDHEMLGQAICDWLRLYPLR